MANGIGNVDFMILFTYISMASILIRLVNIYISAGRSGATRRVGVFSLNESPGNAHARPTCQKKTQLVTYYNTTPFGSGQGR